VLTAKLKMGDSHCRNGMVKFLHTADWQMGAKLLQLGVKAKEGRALRLKAVENILRVAKTEEADFVIIAGDLFEDPEMDDAVVRRTVDLLNQFSPIPVWVLPGNHDPLLPGGVWDRRSWQQIASNVHLLTEPKEVDAGAGTVLYPCPLTQKQSTRDPTAWIPPRAKTDSRIRIGVAHGALAILPTTPNFPIPPDRPESSGLDYLALGDWHGYLGLGPSVYPGTPEQTSFSEKEPGSVVIVTITEAGGVPAVERVRVGNLTWADKKPTIQDSTDVDALAREVEKIASLSSLALRIRPEIARGASLDIFARLDDLRTRWSDSAWYLDWPEEPATIAEAAPVELPAGLLVDVDTALAGLAEGRRPEGPLAESVTTSREVAANARALLHRLASEALK
jgi:hypothetical protein